MANEASGFFGRLLARTPNLLSIEFNSHFDTAKKTSDYIGMIVRLAFVAYVTSFFWKTMKAETGVSFTFVTMWICCLATALLTLRFGFQIGDITWLYLHRRMAGVRSGPVKVAVFIMYSVANICFASGLVALVLSLPKPG